MESDFRRKVGTLFVALFLVLTPTLTFAQGIITGSISGTVVDQQQAMISGAKVTAKDVSTNREFTTETNAVGFFTLRSLPVGTYTVTIEAAKFTKLKISNVVVTSARDTAVGAQTLSVGAEEVVNVESTAPLIETASSQVGGSFEAAKVSGLPNAGGGFDNLALYVPGMVTMADSDFSNSNGADLASNGQRGRSNNFQIDGQSNNDNSVAGPGLFLNNPESLGEFQVINSNYSAEYGRNMGSVINYVTKTGSNSFHGSLFEYHINSYFYSLSNDEKAPNPFGSGATGPTNEIENRFGGSFGGPIVKDKAWFFYSIQGDRIRSAGNPSNTNLLTPTPGGIATLQAAYPGNSAVNALATIGPHAVAAGNPVAFGTPQILNVTNGVTATNVEFAGVERFLPSLFNEWEHLIRADIQVTSKDRFFARYIYENQIFTNATGRFAAGAVVDVPAKPQQIGVDWVHNFSSTLINQFRFSYGRLGVGFESGTFAGCTQAGIIGAGNCPTGITFLDPQLLTFGMQSNLPQGRLVNNSQWQDNLQIVKGRHTIKFGGEYARQRSPAVFLPNILGTFSFPNLGDDATSFSAFLSNTPSSLALTDGPPSFNFKEQDISFYFQDDWRIKDNLTLQLGIRYEWFQQAINLLNNITVANMARTPPLWNPALPANVTTTPRIDEDTNNWGPNFGFAWTPRIWEGLFGRDKTVIRGGYRIAYDPAFYNIFLNVATSAPVVNAGTPCTTTATCITNGVGIPAGGAFGSDVRTAFLGLIPTGGNPGTRLNTRVADGFHNPYTQQWSLGMERVITPKIALKVRYVGNHTVGNFQTINGNPSLTFLAANFPSEIPSGLTPCTTAGTPGLGRADCNFSLLRIRNNGAWSNYHGLQTSLDIQNWHNLTAGFAHTWSRALDNVSEIFATGAGGNTNAVAQNVFDPNRPERGVTATSFPHVASFYWIYELPWFKSQQGVLGHFLGGWQMNGTWRYQSGQAHSLSQSIQSSSCDTGFATFFIGIDSCRPILNNPSAPIDSVGVLRNATGTQVTAISNCSTSTLAPGFPVGNPTTCPFVPIDQFHWLINNDFAALFFGDPFLGAGRNILRGETINNVDFSILKNTKITERVTIQFRAEAFNVLNRQFRANPGVNANSRNITGVTYSFPPPAPVVPVQVSNPGSFLNTAFNGSNIRFLQFGLRLVF